MNRRCTQINADKLVDIKLNLRPIVGYFTQKKAFFWVYILIIFGFVFTSAIAFGIATLTPVIAQPTTPPVTQSTPIRVAVEELYFVDVMVRGRPVIQVGSLDGVSATERARIINRRIAALLLQPESLGEVTVHIDQENNIATLRVNNRLLFSLPISVLYNGLP